MNYPNSPNPGGWNPDAVAPPMKGGVYERERPHYRITQNDICDAIVVMIGFAILFIGLAVVR